MHSFAPLASKFRVADTFTGLLELSALPQACMCAICVPGQLPSPSAFSGHDLLLPVGKSGSFDSVGPYLHVPVCIQPYSYGFHAMCVCAHDQHVCTASGLNLVVSPCFNR